MAKISGLDWEEEGKRSAEGFGRIMAIMLSVPFGLNMGSRRIWWKARGADKAE